MPKAEGKIIATSPKVKGLNGIIAFIINSEIEIPNASAPKYIIMAHVRADILITFSKRLSGENITEAIKIDLPVNLK